MKYILSILLLLFVFSSQVGLSQPYANTVINTSNIAYSDAYFVLGPENLSNKYEYTEFFQTQGAIKSVPDGSLIDISFWCYLDGSKNNKDIEFLHQFTIDIDSIAINGYTVSNGNLIKVHKYKASTSVNYKEYKKGYKISEFLYTVIYIQGNPGQIAIVTEANMVDKEYKYAGKVSLFAILANANIPFNF